MRYFIDRTAKELDEVVTKALATKTYLSFSRISHPLVTDGEIKPTNVVPVIAPSPSGIPNVYAMQWGFEVPGKIYPIFNARSETARIRPTFKEGWEKHRCIIPASYYFEWEHLTDEKGRKKTGNKYLIQPKDYSITWLCGLYRIEEGRPYFVILTREPDETTSAIHNRMPVILPTEHITEWTDPNENPERVIRYSLTRMVAERA
ncbi:MAG: SOS response-associated peptidase family protein [Lachnospiraceae bacterium]|nr:SOS response-associated peptidase family protein [Lachnospiraceae bacterium]MBR4145992.1 SOS response-associated peptidase family protein [Lachnospiraceae bacterium]